MKNMIYLFISILLFACSDDENVNTVIGSWQLVENYGSDGNAAPHWYPVEDGFIYTFTNNGIINSSEYECSGTFDYNSSENITINFDCPDMSFNGSFDIVFENNYLILTPNPSSCDEGCSEKFL